MERIEGIWYRRLTDGDFFNIERRPDAGPAGGGGQTYVDIPTLVRKDLFELLHVAEPANEAGPWPHITRNIHVLGAPEVVAQLRFELNRAGETRYRIARQLRQSEDSERHPAWTPRYGFPQAPNDVASPEEARRFLPPGGVRLILVLTFDGALYAGHTSGSAMPANWPRGFGLEALFARGAGGLLRPNATAPTSPLVLDPSSERRPFTSGDHWSDEESALLLETYLQQGAQGEDSPVVRSVEQQILNSGRPHRTRQAIAEKLAAYERLDPTTGQAPTTDAATSDTWARFAGDGDALDAAIQQFRTGAQLPPSPPPGPIVQVTPVETTQTPVYTTRGTAPTLAERREQRLVHQYKEYLQALGRTVTAHAYYVLGYPTRLRCDLFDETDQELVEAKGTVSREAIRMALGQLLDYRRFETAQVTLVVLLPWQPSPDLLGLVASAGVVTVWRTPDGFGRRNP